MLKRSWTPCLRTHTGIYITTMPMYSSSFSMSCMITTSEFAAYQRRCASLFLDRSHCRGSSFSINDIFEKFFAEVMLRVYELIHSGQHLSDEYKQCIVDNMDTIRPFGRSTDLITPQVSLSTLIMGVALC